MGYDAYLEVLLSVYVAVRLQHKQLQQVNMHLEVRHINCMA